MRWGICIMLVILLELHSSAQRPLLFNKVAVENPQISFTRLTTDAGLSNNRVTSTLQDNYGYIWIGTIDGLNRYDSRSFEVFKHNSDNYTSISSSHISSMTIDSKGNLFIGTKNGVNQYNRVTNSFSLLKLNNDSLDFNNSYVRQMLLENDTTLWVDTQQGILFQINLLRNSIINTFTHPNSPQPYYLYHDIYVDKTNKLWLGIRGCNPLVLEKNQTQFKSISSSENDFTKKRAADVACYYEDSKGNFWVTGLDGVYLFDEINQTFSKFMAVTTYDILEDKKGNIWFGTGSGLFKYLPIEKTMTVFVNEKDNPNSISNNSVYNIMEDAVGNIWLATHLGINILNPSAFPFNTYTHIPGIENSPEGFVVTAIAEDEKHNLWIGYKEDGLDYFNVKTDNFTHHLSNSKVNNSLASNHVSALYYDLQNKLWIGLWQGIGFNLFDPITKRFSLFTYYKNNLEKDWYSDFCEDNNGNFYIGFWGGDGFTLFDREKLQFGNSLKNKFDRVDCSRIISRIFKDNHNKIWVGTTECGLHKYDAKEDTSMAYFTDGKTVTGLTSNDIKDITQDNQGNIWVLTNTLQQLNNSTGKFNSYSLREGFFTQNPISFVFDKQGLLWIATQGDGLFKFNPVTKHFTQYLKQDGIQSNTFTKARALLDNGNLFFGGVNGFNLFSPQKIIPDSVVPQPFFGRLMIYDHIYSHDLNQLTNITFNPKDKVFSIELNSSDMANPERYQYQCKLSDFDENWVNVDNTVRKVRFVAIPPGNYTLQYRLGDRKGHWSKSTNLKIKILRPFYQTAWFILGLVLLIISILVLYIRRREYEIKLQGRAIELQQKVFRLQMNPHFMGNSLLAIQNYIYSHNPLEAGNYLSDFARLFRLILNNSKSEFITISKEIETLELYLKLQTLRFPEKFTYSIEVDKKIDLENYMIPPMLAQPIIENALEHGLFKKEGKGKLVIRFIHQLNHLIFEVDDDGIGLSAALQRINPISEHKSSALNITQERVSILGRKYEFLVSFEIKEKKDQEENPLGTTVAFTIPFLYRTIENT